METPDVSPMTSRQILLIERETLLLRPWTSTSSQSADDHHKSSSPCGFRDIVDPTTGENLGAAYWRLPETYVWLTWLTGTGYEICAAKENVSLFSVLRSRLAPTRWKVYDANRRWVGSLRGKSVWGVTGRTVATIEHNLGQEVSRLCAPAGQELATLNRSPSGVLVQFASELEANPLAKMILLATALAITTE